MNNFTFIEVCSGCGGLSSGLIDAGFIPLLLNDNNKDCCETLKINHKNTNIICSSMENLDLSNYIDKVDLFAGGIPCFIEGTKVLTYNGYKNIENVLLNDKLLTHTGNFQNILNLQQKIYNGDLYEIKIKYHSEIIKCTNEHPFYIREKNNDYSFEEPKWKIAKELTMNDYFGMVINNKEIIPEFTFDKINIKLDNLDYWYVLGYFIGNGRIEDERIKNFMFEKNIPEWIQDAPKEFIQEFINGYIKANGCIINNKIIQITNVSYNLAYGLQRLYLKLGHIFSIIKNVNQKDTYTIKRILQKNKNASSFIENNYVWYAPFKITKKNIIETNVYNFEVDNDNSYIVENTIVHNCQSYSQSGLRKGLNDPRGKLIIKFIEIIDLIKPKIFMIENVKGLLTHNNGKTILEIIDLLDKNKLYNIQYKLLNSKDYGVPQKRERVFIIGTMKNKNINYIFPEKNKKEILLKDVLYDVPSSIGAKYNENKINLFKMIPQGGCWINLPEELQKSYLGNSFKSKGGKRGILYRLSMNKQSLTLLCTPSQKQTERCHPLEERPLNIREYARIQTFNDDYEFYGSLSSQYKQIGNAVPVELAKYIGISLINSLMQ